MSFLNNLKIGSRLQIVVALSVIALITVQIFALAELHFNLLEDRKQKTREHVETAHSLIVHYANRAQKGEISKDAAQKAALAAVEQLRYSGKEYFWVNDMHPTMLMHPYAKKLNGKDLSGFEDKSGKKLFVAFVNKVKESKSGFVDYLWPKPGAKDPVAKISYVQGYAPWGWIVGSGIYIDDVNAIFMKQVIKSGALTLGMLLLLLAVTFAIGRSIARRLGTTTASMDQLATGDCDFEIFHAEDRDEIGSLARSLSVFRDNALKMEKLAHDQKMSSEKAKQEETQRKEAQRAKDEEAEAEKRKAYEAAEAERKQAMLDMADAFEQSVKEVVEVVSSAAGKMQSNAQSMSSTADQTNRQATLVAAASEEATGNVQTVASAAEELSSSIQEIGRQVTQSNEIAQAAVAEAKQTNEKVEGLADAAQKIGDVVNLINDIASQTNLLALNATIEAARAGDAGKGFAVVASEVKSLATQTGKATEEIGSQISSIQEATGEAVQAIQGIGTTIGEIGDIATSVASAVNEQGSATREIAASVQQAASGTQEVSNSIAEVTSASSETQNFSGQILEAASELSSQSEVLSEKVDKFLAELRAA